MTATTTTAEPVTLNAEEHTAFHERSGLGPIPSALCRVCTRVAPAPVAPLVSLCGTCTSLPGVLLASDTPEGIQRCDECGHYDGDLAAAAAVAALLPGAVVRWLGERADTPADDEDEPEQTEHTGTEVPAGVCIAEGTSPWVEVDGTPVDWMTTPAPVATGTWQTDSTEHDSRNGQAVTVLRHITEPDADHDADVLPMLSVRFPDGTVLSAWPEEVDLTPSAPAETPEARQYREQAEHVERLAHALATGTLVGPRHAAVARLRDAVDTLAAWTTDDRTGAAGR